MASTCMPLRGEGERKEIKTSNNATVCTYVLWVVHMLICNSRWLFTWHMDVLWAWRHWCGYVRTYVCVCVVVCACICMYIHTYTRCAYLHCIHMCTCWFKCSRWSHTSINLYGQWPGCDNFHLLSLSQPFTMTPQVKSSLESNSHRREQKEGKEKQTAKEGEQLHIVQGQCCKRLRHC